MQKQYCGRVVIGAWLVYVSPKSTHSPLHYQPWIWGKYTFIDRMGCEMVLSKVIEHKTTMQRNSVGNEMYCGLMVMIYPTGRHLVMSS